MRSILPRATAAAPGGPDEVDALTGEGGGAGRGRRIAVAALLLVLLLFGVTDVRRRARVDPANPSSHRSDVTVYTGAGAAFFEEGVDPYEVKSPRGWHYLYPPLFAIVLAPLDALPGSEQGFVFYLLSLVLLWASLVETSRILSLSVPGIPRGALGLFDRAFPRWIAWSAVLAVLFPLLNCLQRGQVAPFTLYPLMLGARILLEKRTWARLLVGGVILALPVAIKLTPLLPVAFVGWVLWLRAAIGAREPGARARLRDAAGLTSGVAVGLAIWILLVPALFVGWSANLGHLSTWVDRVVSNESFDEENDFYGASRRNQSFHNGARLLVGTFVDEPGARETGAPGERYRSELNAAVPKPSLDLALFVARVAMVLLMLAAGVRLARSGTALDVAAALGLGAIGSVVFSPLSWGHHYGIIWPAVVFVPALWWARGLERRARGFAYAAAALSLAHYFFTGPLGSIGMLGIGSAVWFVGAIVMMPRGTVAPAANARVG